MAFDIDWRDFAELPLIRSKNNRLRTNKAKQRAEHLKLSERSGLPVEVLKLAARGVENAMASVMSNLFLTNKLKNRILSASIGREPKLEITTFLFPTFTFTKKWRSPVKATVCGETEGYTNHCKVTTLGGGQGRHVKKNKIPVSKVDFSSVSPTDDWNDILPAESKPQVTALNVQPVEAELVLNYLNLFPDERIL